MTQSLSPGWAVGPAVRCDDPLHPPPSPAFPPHTRLGLLARLTPTSSGVKLDIPSGAIVVRTSTSAVELLALLHLNAAGLILTASDNPAPRHAVVAARAAGLPVAWIPNFSPPRHDILLDTSQATPRVALPDKPSLTLFDVVSPPLLPRVTPISQLHRHSSPWVELVTGQPEEICRVRQVMANQTLSGVGLLRLEFLSLMLPSIDTPTLTTLLTERLAALLDLTVCLRLTDWAADKPPPSHGPLKYWDGRRGLDGIAGTPSLEAQISAIQHAQRITQHPDLRIIAPHVGELSNLRRLAEALSPLPCIAMLESHAALDAHHRYASAVDGFWFGLGDLGQDMAIETIMAAAVNIQQHFPAHAIALCGHPWTPTDSIDISKTPQR